MLYRYVVMMLTRFLFEQDKRTLHSELHVRCDLFQQIVVIQSVEDHEAIAALNVPECEAEQQEVKVKTVSVCVCV